MDNNLMNVRLALANTFKFAKMSGALAPGKHIDYGGWCLYFHVRTIESPITRAVSSGFSVGASLIGENLFYVLIGTEELGFDPRLGRITQPPNCPAAWALMPEPNNVQDSLS